MGLSQAELGERVGVHIAHLSRLENGKSQPSVEMLWKISHALGVSMDYLMDEDADEIAPVSVKDKSLAKRIELLEQLDDTDRQTIINVIDSMLTKKKMGTFNVYFEFTNLLNTMNVTAVYPYTGTANDDGYLSAPEWQNAISQQVNEQSFRDLYTISMDNPYRYSAPRTIRLGVMFNF